MADKLQNVPQYHRHCPGEERIVISDAICLGRRRSRFPKCKGCPFNDDENPRGGPTQWLRQERTPPEAEKNRKDHIETMFRAYDIRGTYPDPLNADTAWRIGLACAQFLRSELRGYDRGITEKSTVIVGRDMRKSSVELSEALIEGLRAGGSPVINIGMIDTPQLYFAVNQLSCCGGVQVTASHNPGQYNGFKICGQKGKPVSTDTGLTKVSKIARNTIRHTATQLSPVQSMDLTDAYRKFVRSFLHHNEESLAGRGPIKVVIDASNGMAGRWIPLIFGDLEWLEIVRLNFEHNGEFVHDPNPLEEHNLAQLQDRMIRSKADFGLCFDGDADRLVLVDEQGQIVRSDLLTALMAPYFLKEMPGSTVVYDLRCSRVVAEEIRKAGGIARRERCGHAFIKKVLADIHGAFAGELSGHFYFRDNWFCDSGMIAFAEVLNILIESGKNLSELIAPLRRYTSSGERNFHNDHKDTTLKILAERYDDAQVDYLDGLTVQYKDWWFNVRTSQTEPYLRLNAEAATAELLDVKLAELYPIMGTPANGHEL